MKAKQFQKGVAQLAQEGAIQVYRNQYNEVVIGAVGQLQFEVFEYRLKNEYNAQVRMDRLDFSTARWVQIDADPSSRDYAAALEKIKDVLDSRTMLVFDHFERPIILFANQFTLQYFCENTRISNWSKHWTCRININTNNGCKPINMMMVCTHFLIM